MHHPANGRLCRGYTSAIFAPSPHLFLSVQVYEQWYFSCLLMRTVCFAAARPKSCAVIYLRNTVCFACMHPHVCSCPSPAVRDPMEESQSCNALLYPTYTAAEPSEGGAPLRLHSCCSCTVLEESSRLAWSISSCMQHMESVAALLS